MEVEDDRRLHDPGPGAASAAPLPTVTNRAMRRTTDPDVAVTSRRYVPAAAARGARASALPLGAREDAAVRRSRSRRPEFGRQARRKAGDGHGRDGVRVGGPLWSRVRFTTTLPPAGRTGVAGFAPRVKSVVPGAGAGSADASAAASTEPRPVAAS